MAAWRPTDRDRDPISDQRALASQLQIEVRENLRFPTLEGSVN